MNYAAGRPITVEFEMRSCIASIMTAFIASVGFDGTAKAAELDGPALAKRALEDSIFSRANAKAEVELVIYRSGKKYRQRRLETKIKRDQDEGQRFSLLTFVSPPDMAGTKLLSREEGDDRRQFLFLPAYRRTKRIGGDDKKKAFMQTDFSYADVEGIRLEDWTWKRQGAGEANGTSCVKVEGRAKIDETAYSRVNLCVHAKSFVNLQTLFFDDAGELEKAYVVEKVKKQDGRWIVTRARLETPKKRSKTLLKVTSLDLRSKLPRSDFTRAALER